MSEVQKKPRPVIWRPEHLEELERLFPEQTAKATAESDMAYDRGQRSVVSFVRLKVANAAKGA